INELSHVQIPVMLMPDDFKAYSKIKVDNHLFNKRWREQMSSVCPPPCCELYLVPGSTPVPCVGYELGPSTRLATYRTRQQVQVWFTPVYLSFAPQSDCFRENMPSHFKFKEYCPMVFRNLRERFGIDDQDFQTFSRGRTPEFKLKTRPYPWGSTHLVGSLVWCKQLCQLWRWLVPRRPLRAAERSRSEQGSATHNVPALRPVPQTPVSALANSSFTCYCPPRSAPLPNDSQARSGARFHTSYDKRYIIKTITSEDVAEMHNILKKYHQYIVECHGVTLLPQFLGMYRLNVDGVEIYVIVTRNVFSHRLSVYRKYDLK
ncbi:Phosphatidylinositol 5-phosphate 4-kinase type-2 alpha, partial [Galemys pyrenaicus]